MNISGLIAFIAINYFTVSSILIHFLKPDLFFLRYPLTRYVIGESGIVMTAGLYCCALTEIIIGHYMIKSARKITPPGFFCILGGLGLIIVAAFPMDLSGKNQLGGLIHYIGGIVYFLTFPVFTFLCYNLFSDRKLKLFSGITGIVSFVLFLMLAYSIYFYKNEYFFSITEKIDLLVFIVWLQVISKILMRDQDAKKYLNLQIEQMPSK